MLKFTIDIDRFHAILDIKGYGAWTEETAETFLASEREAIGSLGMHLREVSILFDATQFPPQPQEVIARLRNPANAIWNTKRAAFVTPPGAGRMQIEQNSGQDHIRLFEHVSEAWIYLTKD